MDMVAGQDLRKMESVLEALCKPAYSQRGEGGVGFLVQEFLVKEVEFIARVFMRS